jgi:hypothetical protein
MAKNRKIESKRTLLVLVTFRIGLAGGILGLPGFAVGFWGEVEQSLDTGTRDELIMFPEPAQCQISELELLLKTSQTRIEARSSARVCS